MSPSTDPHGELERGLECLRELGLEPVLAEHALAETGYTAGSPHDRAADINTMFADPSIRAVIASHGGQVAHEVLPHLEWDTIAANPTIFMGFSNITTLNLAIHARTRLVTFNGNMVMWHLGMDPTDYDLDEFRAVLMEGRSGPVAKNSSWVTVRDGDARPGRLIGDAMSLRGLAQTSYQVPFDDDLLLFFEGASDPPGAAQTYLHHLEFMGVFERTRGVLIGYDGESMWGEPEVPFADILLEVTDRYDFPIVTCDDFGHGCPNTVLPIGAPAVLHADTATLEVVLPAVS